jgi:general secretion pathway protein I
VLVAVSILGLGLSVILSSQAGLFASAQRVEHLTQSSNLLRCKMAEVELELMQLGFPLIEKTERGPCCGDEPGGPYTCEWTVQTVELPQPASFGADGDGKDGKSPSGADLASSSSTPGMPGMPAAGIGQLASALGGMGQSGKPASLGDMTEAMSQVAPDGGGGLLQMAVGMVYPSIKPLLEASIRKVTVRVHWREGRREQELVAVQYVTNPLEGGLNPNAANAMNALMDAAGLGTTPGSGTPGQPAGTPGATSSPATPGGRP